MIVDVDTDTYDRNLQEKQRSIWGMEIIFYITVAAVVKKIPKYTSRVP